MAPERGTLLTAGGLLLLLLAVLVVPSASGCNRGFYERMINDFCFTKFELDMGGVERGLWCSWPDTMETYEALTNCSYQVALRMDCYWPNQVVDRFFVHIHQIYFQDCALTGRLLHDPPVGILGPFIAVPVLVTLLMTALVVWRSKRTEGVL
ncbi:receptor activity-modifying protein 1-like [Hippoglossus hippoglossus]|uniref:receptor activity-modifying protein 1-like n=1 Tax=Hippoglossus hippoglossus TaxID=8267 RepID=UPI00148C9F47|nr:receptor activity-modifying protein 1-like [Hippoglossus hippoglossus]